MGANNIGGEVDVTDPRDLVDLGDADEVVKDNKGDLEDQPNNIPPKRDDKNDKGDLPPSDEEELEDTDEEVDEKEEEEETDEKDEKDDEEIEEIDITTPHARPSFKEITEKYPKFFKEFPAVREALGREKAYTDVFPTVQDAKEAGETIEHFNELQASILSGDPSLLLGTLHSNNEKALNKFAKNFLPTIKKGNPELFSSLVTPYIKLVFRNALHQAEVSDSKNLKLAVKWMARFVFNDADGNIPEDEREVEDKGNDETSSPLAEENKRLKLTTLRNFSQDIKDRTEKVLEREILKSVDPEDALPSFMQEALVGKVIREIQVSLNSDKEHTRVMTTLWNQAKKNDYSKEDRGQLINAFLARARKILPSIRDKHKKEVMSKLKLSSNGKDSKEGQRPNRRRIPESGIVTRQQGTPKAGQINWKKTSDEDILNDRYVPKQ